MFEGQYPFQESRNIIQNIKGSILEGIIKILREKTVFPNGCVFEFLGESEKEESILVMFELIRRFKKDICENSTKIEQISNALHKLYPRNTVMIRNELNTLIKSSDEDLTIIGEKIQNILSWKRYS